MPLPIDHLVLAVPDLPAAAARYRALGFTVGSRNRHPWRTENHIVQLDGVFLEIIGLAEDYASPRPADPAAPFALAVEAAVRRGGGLALLALRTDSSEAEAARLMAAGLGSGRLLRFGRSADMPDGTQRELAFTLAFAELADLPEAGVFTCQHARPDHFWSAAARSHANGARSVTSVTLGVDPKSAEAARVARVCDTDEHGPPPGSSIETGGGRIDLVVPAGRLPAAPVRFTAFRVAVPSLDPLRGRLATAAIPFRDGPEGIAVEPEHAFGVTILFDALPLDPSVPPSVS